MTNSTNLVAKLSNDILYFIRKVLDSVRNNPRLIVANLAAEFSIV